MRATLAVMAVIAALAVPAAAEDTLTARGNEPSWRIEISAGGGITFEAPGLGLTFNASSYTRSMVDGRPRLTARQGAETLEVTVIEKLCADTMTGMPFPIGIVISLGGKRFEGCGGDMMTALEGGWRVIRIGDALLPGGVIATVVFGAEGQVSGRTGCNRFSGLYHLSGEGLGFGDLAVTRMACPPPQTKTEQQFLGFLRKVTRVTPGENARLRLMAGDEQAMVLDRVD